MRFEFKVEAASGEGRLGLLRTAHGVVHTPAFMPVGTAATVKAMTPEMVRESGAEILLANTYHLMLRPGAARIASLGGLHRFMNWDGPILTDSGGFQVWSLAKLREIHEEGVIFRSHLDGARLELTPERAIEIQHLLDADITMAFDECTAWPTTKEDAAKSMRLSMRWAERSKAAFREREGYGVFGIVQGSVFPDLRIESAERLGAIGFDGYAIGGLSVGEAREKTAQMLNATVPRLPKEKPRYLMGVGMPEDLVDAVLGGIDLFDCVLPTRSGRTGQAFTRKGKLSLRNARHADDPAPLDPACRCPACTGYSRAYLHHLTKSGEILGAILLTTHNLHYYQDLMSDLRDAIGRNTLAAFATAFRAELRNDEPEEG